MGKVRVENQTQPLNLPTSGHTDIYVDSTTKKLTSIDDQGNVINYGLLSEGAIEKVTTMNSNVLLDGGVITINSLDNTKLDIAEMKVIFADSHTDPTSPNITSVTIPAKVGVTNTNIANSGSSFVWVNSSYNIVFTNPLNGIDGTNLRDYVFIGVVYHPDRTTHVSVNDALTGTPIEISSSLVDFNFAIGQLNLNEGNIYGPAGNNLTVYKSPGYLHFSGVNYKLNKKNPNIQTVGEFSPALMSFMYRDGLGGITTTPISTTINPNRYDNGTGGASPTPNGIVSTGYWTVFRFYMLPSVTLVHYGQSEHETKSEAIASIDTEQFYENPELRSTLFRGYLVVKQGTTDLSDINNAQFFCADKYGNRNNCGGILKNTDTFNTVYSNTEGSPLLLNKDIGGIIIQDAATPITSSLISILKSNGIDKSFDITPNSVILPLNPSQTSSLSNNNLSFEYDHVNYELIGFTKDTNGDEVRFGLNYGRKEQYFETSDKEIFKQQMDLLNRTSKKVVWVGDSIVEQGKVGYGNNIGFTTYIEQLYPEITYVNEGVGGNTTLDVLNRISTITANNGDLYVVAIGLNDARYYDTRGAQSDSEFITNIGNIKAALEAAGGTVVFVTIWMSYWEDAYRTSSKFITDSRISRWNNLLSNYCKTNSILLLDACKPVCNYVNIHNVQSLIPDGVHPEINGTLGKQLYADGVLNDYIHPGKYSTELVPTGKHFFKLVIEDNTADGSILTGGYVGLKNISTTVVEKYGLTSNTAYADITQLFGSYASAYAGFYNKASDFPLILTFSTATYPTNVINTGIVSGTGINRGIRPYKLYYTKQPEALTDLNHESWDLTVTNTNKTAISVNLLPSNAGAKIYYQLRINTVGNSQPNVQLKKIGTNIPNKVYTVNVVTTSAQRYDLLFSGTLSSSADALVGNAPTYSVMWETPEFINSLVLDSFNSSLGNFGIYQSYSEEALTSQFHPSWNLLKSGTGNGTYDLTLKPSYGELYNTTGTVRVTTLGTYYGFTNALAGEVAGAGYVTFTDDATSDKLTIGTNGGGMYKVTIETSFATSAADLITGMLYKNDSQVTKIQFNRSTSINSTGSASATGFISLASGDTIDIRFTAGKNGTVITFSLLNLNITRIA